MSPLRVSLRSALKSRSPLQGNVVDGTDALTRAHVALIAPRQRGRVGDSLDLDLATRAEMPESPRWDYLLSVPDSAQIVGLEPHSASTSEVQAVIAKKKSAQTYLRDHLLPGHRVARWFWVSAGAVTINPMEKARRLLDQNGITFVGRVLTSLD